MRRLLNTVLTSYFRKFDPTFLTSLHPYYSQVVRSEGFDELYDRGIGLTKTKQSLWRRDRFYNLYSALDLVRELEGNVIELGCYKGLSSYVLCSRLKDFNHGFLGEDYIICDSFEGLSTPSEKDNISASYSGMFAEGEEVVRENLREFPNVKYYKGWIPKVLESLPEQAYRFVHVDVDLVDPTISSFEYFYPRLVDGGLLICDDYGGRTWKGTKAAVDEFCKKYNCKSLRLSTGQIIIIKGA